MEGNPQQPEDPVSALDVAIATLGAAEKFSITPVKEAFGAVNALLTLIRVFSTYPLTIGLPVHVSLDIHGQPTELPRPRAVLR